MTHRVLLLLIFLLAVASAPAAANLNMVLLKKNTQIFEGIVGQILKQNFPSPFAVPEEPEGAYLEGYGVIVSFHLNVNRSAIRTPFGEIPARNGGRPKQQQLQILRDSMIRCLADYGATFKQLGDSNRISISAHVEDRNELDPVRRTTVVIISVSQGDVELLASNQISFDAFKAKVRVVEY